MELPLKNKWNHAVNMVQDQITESLTLPPLTMYLLKWNCIFFVCNGVNGMSQGWLFKKGHPCGWCVWKWHEDEIGKVSHQWGTKKWNRHARHEPRLLVQHFLSTHCTFTIGRVIIYFPTTLGSTRHLRFHQI